MSVTLILPGRKTLKWIIEDEEYREVRPYLAADKYSIGIFFQFVGEPDGWFWGTIMPRSLLWYYRAMKLFEAMPSIRIHGSIPMCFDVMRSVYTQGLPTSLAKLDEAFGSTTRARRYHVRAFASAPGPRQLSAILKTVDAHRLSIDDRNQLIAAARNTWERVEGSRAKARITEAMLRDAAVRDVERAEAERLRKERELAAKVLPLPHERIRRYFKWFGLAA